MTSCQSPTMLSASVSIQDSGYSGQLCDADARRRGGRGRRKAPFRSDLGQGLPDLLGHERHDRVQEPAETVKDRCEHALGGRSRRRVSQAALLEFDIPVAEVVPGEIAEPLGCIGEAELFEVRRCEPRGPAEKTEDPAVFDG